MSNQTKLLCLFLRAQKVNKSSEQGYAMAIVSLLTIILFSLLAASLVFSNLAKSRTDAFVDGTSAFAVAEAGLNKRAVEFRAKLETYSGVTDISALTANRTLADCFGVGISSATSTGLNSLGCRNYSFESSNNISRVAQYGGISLGGGQDKNTYIAYTLISKNTPQNISIPANEPFEGLNAAEYKYVLHATAKKPVDSEGTVVATGSVTPTAEEAAAGAKEAADRTAADLALIAAYDEKQAAANVAATEAATKSAGAEKSSNNISLSMTFTNRVVPLFQFGIFYNGDMELNSTSQMQIKGWVHSNANIYVQPAGVETLESESITTFLAKVSAAGKIYNRVDAWSPGIGRTGITRVLLTGDDCSTATNCQSFPAYDYHITDPLTSSQISAFPNKKVQDGNAGAIVLKTPEPGFARKRNYFNNKVGIYYSQADMRLEMVPDRDLGTNGKTTATWDRNKAIIPFNFTSIKTSGAATDVCTTTAPAANTDPDATYIDPKRENVSNLKCHQFTKGQLQSLRQPVLVLTKLNQSNTTLRAIEGTTLGIPNPLPTFALTPPALTPPEPSVTETQKNQILRALQVALASTPSPVPFERLNTNFNDPVYGDSDDSDAPICNTGCDATLNPFRTEFKRLIKTIFPVDSAADTNTDKANQAYVISLLAATPNQIASLQSAWFLPAPIQRVERPTQDTDATEAAKNPRSSGFYDGREKRWITMLQTNIASLSVWNRDGLYVNSINETLTLPYATEVNRKTAAFNGGIAPEPIDGIVANSTKGLAFDRANADATKPDGSFQALGLASSDKTEGGLVFHTSVRDDLNGDGNTISADDDITFDTASPIYRKNPNNTDYRDPVTNERTIIDYYRIYPGDLRRQSPFAFAFNGGDYLPSALLLSSDQAVYIQGDFNNNNNAVSTNAANPAVTSRTHLAISENTASDPSEDRLPTSIIADTITVLSNECTSVVPASTNLLKVPLSQLQCGLPSKIDGADTTYASVLKPMTINAAFLSNTNVSTGNYLNGTRSSTAIYSGGVNNYIRLLEDWNRSKNPRALNYTGSLVSIGTPIEYSGDYRSGGGEARTDFPYYNIPFRNFNYDKKFNKLESIPPLTPKASYVQQKNFSRIY